jgi:hypothetical protein
VPEEARVDVEFATGYYATALTRTRQDGKEVQKIFIQRRLLLNKEYVNEKYAKEVEVLGRPFHVFSLQLKSWKLRQVAKQRCCRVKASASFV